MTCHRTGMRHEEATTQASAQTIAIERRAALKRYRRELELDGVPPGVVDQAATLIAILIGAKR